MATEGSPILCLNGRFVTEDEACLSPLDRGFTLADGVFETMVAHHGNVFRLDDHLQRLEQAAHVLGIPLPSSYDLADVVCDTLYRNDLEWAIVRLTVSRGMSQRRGLDVPQNVFPTVVVRVVRWQGPPKDNFSVCHLALSSTPLNEQSPLSRLKSLAYLEKVLARQIAHVSGETDALFLNTRGFVACASSSNIFVVLDGVLATPSISDGALPGIARRTILTEAHRLGMVVSERSLALEEVVHADEVFLTNVAAIVPVTMVDRKSVGKGTIGPVTSELLRAYWGLVRQIYQRDCPSTAPI
jgi:branched-chain amino acid aminotransferase